MVAAVLCAHNTRPLFEEAVGEEAVDTAAVGEAAVGLPPVRLSTFRRSTHCDSGEPRSPDCRSAAYEKKRRACQAFHQANKRIVSLLNTIASLPEIIGLLRCSKLSLPLVNALLSDPILSLPNAMESRSAAGVFLPDVVVVRPPISGTLSRLGAMVPRMRCCLPSSMMSRP